MRLSAKLFGVRCSTHCISGGDDASCYHRFKYYEMNPEGYTSYAPIGCSSVTTQSLLHCHLPLGHRIKALEVLRQPDAIHQFMTRFFGGVGAGG